MHRFFDPIWREGASAGARSARSRAYTWLAARLSLTRDECHVGRFNADTCRRALALVSPDEVGWHTVREWERAQCPDPDPFNGELFAGDTPPGLG